MINYLEENLDSYNLAILLMFVTGMRVGEVVTLKRCDLEENIVKIRRTETRYRVSEHKYEQQFFLTWLAKNVPAMAVISDQEGNVRVNILSHYIYPCIYVNQNHKVLYL